MNKYTVWAKMQSSWCSSRRHIYLWFIYWGCQNLILYCVKMAGRFHQHNAVDRTWM